MCARLPDGGRRAPHAEPAERGGVHDARPGAGRRRRARDEAAVVGGSIVRGLEVEFAGGRAVRIDAETGADVLRAYAARDEGATRLGEVALVDGEGRIGALDTVFFDTLLDENAASHIALGQAYEFTASEDDRERLNRSAIHIDFMIGGRGRRRRPADAGGAAVPVLRQGAWQV